MSGRLPIGKRTMKSSGPLWNLETLQELLTIPFDGPVIRLAFTGDGRFMIVSSFEVVPTMSIWELPSWEGRTQRH